MWKIKYWRQAEKDREKLKRSSLVVKVRKLIEVLAENPFAGKFEKLVGDRKGLYSRRINDQHRLVYRVMEEERVIKIISMWSHYDD
jgi:Txe/YoeB family toxin of toxin-antitoxin system